MTVAKHVGRRTAQRKRIPAYVQLPKFLSKTEIDEIESRKLANPSLDWNVIVKQVIKEGHRQ